MPAPTRTDKNKLPGTTGAGTSEGAIADGQIQIEVTILIAGSPAAVQADYSTLAGTALTATTSRISWKKR